jgi:hypothetical protein
VRLAQLGPWIAVLVRMQYDNRAPPVPRMRPLLSAALLLAGLIASGGVARADELVVDNADAAVRVTGAWQANSTSPGFYGGDYLFHVPGDSTSSVTWPFPNTAVPGTYAVFARWTSGQNRTTVATYVISSGTGRTDVQMNQRLGGARWHPLGTYRFGPNRGQGVSLSDRADGVVVADALVWVGPVGAANVSIGPEALASAHELQRSVDAGDEPWRLDPLESARADAVALGLPASNSFQLLSVQAGEARVRAQDGRVSYDIRVVQPARLGPTGIWVVDRVSRTPAQ